MLKKIFDRSEGAVITNIKTCFYSSLAFGIIAALLRSLAFITSFDEEIGYFDGSFFPGFVNCLLIVACACAVIYGFIISKKARLPVKLDTKPNSVFFTSCFFGFVLIADFVYKLLVMLGEERFADYAALFSPGFRSESAYLLRATAVIELVGLLSSLLSAVCFFLRATKKSDSKLAVWLGFFPVVRALVGVASIYFDMNIQMNHPSKLMLQFALISIMLCLLFEQRFVISESHARPRLYFASACIAFILAFSGGASEMFGYFAGYLKRGDFCIEAFICFTFSLYILARANAFVMDASRPEPEQGITEEPESEETQDEKKTAEGTVSE